MRGGPIPSAAQQSSRCMARLIAGLRGGSQAQATRCLTPQSDFGAVHPKHQGIAAGGAAGCRYRASGEKAQLHQTPAGISRKSNAFNNSTLTFAEFQQGRRG
jgi:hypothetical protein